MRKESIQKIILVFLLLISAGVVFAEDIVEEPIIEPAVEESITELVAIRISGSGNELEFAGFPLAEPGTASIQDSGGKAHDIDSRSVLAVLYSLDQGETEFKMGELVYYPTFGALYLRCMKISGVEECDNWLYEVNDESPSVGMDNFILEDGDSVEIRYEVFDWGGGEEDEVITSGGTSPEAVEEEPEPEPEQISGSAGGGHVRAILIAKEETEPEKIIVPVATEMPVPAYIAFPEFYTPKEISSETPDRVRESETEQITESEEKNLVASVTESEVASRPFALIFVGLLVIALVAIF